MLSRRQRAFLLALLTAMSMMNLIDRVEAQTGSLRVASDLQMIGIGGLGGGGHVTWTLTGDEANILRTKVLQMFDEYPAMPKGFAYGQIPQSAIGPVAINSGSPNLAIAADTSCPPFCLAAFTTASACSLAICASGT